MVALGLAIEGTSTVLIGRDLPTGRVMGCYARVELFLGAMGPGTKEHGELTPSRAFKIDPPGQFSMLVGRCVEPARGVER